MFFFYPVSGLFRKIKMIIGELVICFIVKYKVAEVSSICGDFADFFKLTAPMTLKFDSPQIHQSAIR